MRALESALFVMGGDIRNLTVARDIDNTNNIGNLESVRPYCPDDQCYDLIPECINGDPVHCYCVPYSHDFGRSIAMFHQFRRDNPGSDDRHAVKQAFARDYRMNTAIAYQSPLMPSNFNLLVAPDELIECLSETPLCDDAFAWLVEQWCNPPLQKIMVCTCLLYTSPSPRDATLSRMPSSA